MKDRAEKSRFKGLPVKEMTAEQKKAALELLRAGTSRAGYELATALMSLEGLIPKSAEKGGTIRDSEWYFFAVFGKPSATGNWGWRLQGHHLSLNYTLRDGKVSGTTPAFIGGEPAEILSGPRKGERPFGGVEDLAQKLFSALDEDQRKVAVPEQ